MTDVRLYQTNDDGEIDFVNGQAVMDPGLETAAFLSLFGGNENDSGLDADEASQWWGNRDETDPARQYRSETQYLLRSIPATSYNLRRLEDAAGRDLAWLVDQKIASSVAVTVSMPALNRVQFSIEITVQDKRLPFDLFSAWGLT